MGRGPEGGNAVIIYSELNNYIVKRLVSTVVDEGPKTIITSISCLNGVHSHSRMHSQSRMHSWRRVHSQSGSTDCPFSTGCTLHDRTQRTRMYWSVLGALSGQGALSEGNALSEHAQTCNAPVKPSFYAK